MIETRCKLVLFPIFLLVNMKGLKGFFMKKVIKILKISFITLLSLILIFNVYIMIQTKLNPDKVPSVFGYKSFVVVSGSMESEINSGDLIFVKNIDVNDLKVNDIVAFRDNDNLVTTHRIVDEVNINNQKCFKTKGDSNNLIDEGIVCEKQIEGKYQFKIAAVGNFIMFIQKPMGFTIMMLSILIICIFIYFASSKKIDRMSEDELKEFEEFKKYKEKEKIQKDKKNQQKDKEEQQENN